MTIETLGRLEELLRKHEGVKLKPYICPAGNLSVGIGRNLEDLGLSSDELLYLGRSLEDVKKVGITLDEAEYLLLNDIERCINELKSIFDDFDFLPEDVQMVLVDMIFNLGKTRFLGFKKMIKAVKVRDWEEMVKQMRDSRWCEQVKSRCDDNEMIVREFIAKSVS